MVADLPAALVVAHARNVSSCAPISAAAWAGSLAPAIWSRERGAPAARPPRASRPRRQAACRPACASSSRRARGRARRWHDRRHAEPARHEREDRRARRDRRGRRAAAVARVLLLAVRLEHVLGLLLDADVDACSPATSATSRAACGAAARHVVLVFAVVIVHLVGLVRGLAALEQRGPFVRRRSGQSSTNWKPSRSFLFTLSVTASTSPSVHPGVSENTPRGLFASSGRVGRLV